MSTTALLDRPAPVRHLRAVTRPTHPADTTAPAAPAPAQRNLPPGTAPRGFALYVGIDEAKAAASGVSLGVLVDALRRTLGELAPGAETYATVALAPVGSG
ncbi:MAG: winged helix family transcriptional regulator, partial [Microbacterium sp.]